MSAITKIKKGFTLLELMLVIVVITFIAVFAVRMAHIKTEHALVDRASLQIQQILEAATSYYVDQYNGDGSGNSAPPEGGAWPVSSEQVINANSKLITSSYLPQSVINSSTNVMNNPWGQPYKVDAPNGGKTFEVITDVPNQSIAQQLANSLPIASFSEKTKNEYEVTAQVNVPSYNYNNARAVNEVYYYQPGQCITFPTCPAGMHPVATLSASHILGIQPNPGQQSGPVNTIPIEGFQTYMVANGACSTDDLASPQQCGENQAAACIRISTEDDKTIALSPYEANQISIMAAIKCAPGEAPSGQGVNPYDPADPPQTGPVTDDSNPDSQKY